MATDEGAEKGQGSKPCIVSLAPLSRGVPSLSLCPPLPSVPRSLLHIYIHLSTLCVALFCRERGCAARLTRCVTPAVTAAHAFLQIIFASFLCCVQALVHAVDAHLHETSMRRLSGQVCVSPCTSVCVWLCVRLCVTRTRQGLPSPLPQ